MRCATHPNVETELRCATCGIPICPECFVETPVGMKCREHGLSPAPPIHRVSSAGYAAAISVGVVLGGVAGAFILFLALQLPLLLPLLGALLGGGLIAQAMSYSSGWKRGPRLAAAAAAAVGLGTLAGAPLIFGLLVGGGLAGPSQVIRGVGSPLLWVIAALLAGSAYWRLR